VALIVKADDAGLAMAATGRPVIAAAGRGLVLGMPHLLKVLAAVGTAAMLWVGGGIILHGLEEFGVTAPGHLVHDLAHAAGDGFLGWLVSATLAGLLGLAVGAATIPLASAVVVPAWRGVTGLFGARR
jgi:predicted DNA repair protein MutK